MHAPVEQKYVEQMNALAHVLDELFNRDPAKRTTGFALLVFDFGDDKRMNYISNSHREDMLSAMKELIAKFEGRAVDYAGES